MRRNSDLVCKRAVRVARRAALAFVVVFAACDAPSPTVPSDFDPTLPSGSGSVSHLVGATLFVNPDSPARHQADLWRQSRTADAAMMDRMAARPVARWIGDWDSDVRAEVRSAVAAASVQGAVPVLVAYNIPHRDCGLYSAGGSADASSYRQWIRDFAAGLAGRRAVVVLEPDGVPAADCLSASQREERFSLLRDAIQVLKAANATVYLDAGNARWHQPAEIAGRLAAAGIGMADGFSLNVSNFVPTALNVTYGESVSRLVGGRHFIIDTSRNGVGGTSDSQWCNPPGQGLGSAPTTRTGHPLADAFLWIKYPGESDGTCNGGPRAGEWWAEYALGLAQREAAQ